ncbi:hypothetical protein F5882DRAFT_184096 [Hyaloscypha sp. PMI_1271]|nr:hypothetical protein F5882DRAFT_184096 [Hyaloscypha sp. PMI_1271]
MAPRPLLLFTTTLSLALPAAGALLLSTYLYNYPLSASKSRTIKTSSSLSPTSSSAPSLKIINPRAYPQNSFTDSCLITLSKSEVRNLTDEEILARFLGGFFGGWIFMPEKGIISLFRLFGRPMIAVGFTGVPMNGKQILSPSAIEMEKLPEKGTVLLGGNFMVLDAQLKGRAKEDEGWEGEGGESFVEVGFGDDRKGFAGMHRFEVLRLSDSTDGKGEEVGGENGGEGKEGGGVQLWYSSVSCNPRENKLPFPKWVFGFHEFYAQCLFRDGVREVLRI